MPSLSFLDVVHSRHSTRRYSNKKVSLKLIKKILDSARYAPTNCNQQLWNFIVVTKQEIKERLVKEAASSTIVARAPIIIVISYDGWNYKEAIQGGSIALQNILLASTYYGLGCLSMNSYGNDDKVKKILGIPSSEQICCFALLGYPANSDTLISSVPRRPLKEMLHINHFQQNLDEHRSYNPEHWSLKLLIDYQKYYCRKTFLGKEMDIMNSYERCLIKKTLQDSQGILLDLFSYDGAYLRELPSIKIITADLSSETKKYTEASVMLTIFNKKQIIKSTLLNLERENIVGIKPNSCDTITIIYKLERLSQDLQDKTIALARKYLKQEGKLIIIGRKRNIFLNLFFFAIKQLFGDDIRKTGIYAFFGGYKPLSVKKTIELLSKNNFRVVEKSSYFFIPAFFDQALQMLLQYVKSGGSSYLHRIRRENIFTKLLSGILHLQGFSKNPFGSVVVLKCKK